MTNPMAVVEAAGVPSLSRQLDRLIARMDRFDELMGEGEKETLVGILRDMNKIDNDLITAVEDVKARLAVLDLLAAELAQLRRKMDCLSIGEVYVRGGCVRAGHG